ncbi:MAG TPA: dihydrodipicolinate synthase family protein [Candidatus Acidoferrales bacterium]|nr:dihydrodipicolinate synthase family protein [Candidatus Acidoferrales bacterium]
MNLHGVFAPLTTPFAPDGSLDVDRLRENIARYNETPLAGYAMNGSTSESVLLLWSEVYRVWETGKKYAAPGKILIAGTGAESTRETIEHTARAAELGFAAALVRTPSFYKPAINDEMLAEHYIRVADAAKIPVLIYSVPTFTHVTVEASLIARVGNHPNIVGMKDSSGNVEGAAKIIAAAPKSFQTLVGSASTFYESLERGACGAILAVANALPEMCCEIWQSFQNRNAERARELQQKLTAAGKMFGPQYGIAGLKYALDRRGYYGGSPRPPLLPVGDAARREIDAMLDQLLAETAARR